MTNKRFFLEHKAALYSIISLFLRVFTGPLSIFFITTKLTLDNQAVYYTFISIAAIQWVFELGISTSLVQVIAGSTENNKKRAYIKFACLFYSGVIIPLFLCMYLYANWTFDNINNGSWFYPWLLYSLFVSLNVSVNVFYIIEEGDLNINKVYKIRLITGGIYSFSLLLALFFGFGLYSLCISQIFMYISSIYFFRKKIRYVFCDIWKEKSEPILYSVKSILRFQIKISLVWIFGYLYWNFYSIYFYKYVSVDFSALFGASNAVVSSIAIAMTSWTQTKRSIFSKMISNNRYHESWLAFRKTIIFASIGYITLALLFVLIVNYIPVSYSERFFSANIMTSLILMRFIILYHELILIYLRAFQDEPLYKETLLNYIVTPIFVIIAALFISDFYIFWVSFIIQLLFLYLYIKNGYLFFKSKSNVYR